MNINASINALHSVNASFNQMPARIMDSFHNPETKESTEKVFTDMMVGQNSFTANIKAIRTMTTVEDIILNELR
ncbi:MAG: hypothetical protein GY950_09600 [bacterium]|nr:hypothetical protein [bacterium]